jgi:hypothetical protein
VIPAPANEPAWTPEHGLWLLEHGSGADERMRAWLRRNERRVRQTELRVLARAAMRTRAPVSSELVGVVGESGQSARPRESQPSRRARRTSRRGPTRRSSGSDDPHPEPLALGGRRR